LKSAKAMWDEVTIDATTKSTLYILDAEDQLASMKISDNDDPKAHLSELKQHFALMLLRQENLMKMGSQISDTRFNTLIMSSLPDSYRPTLQTITASERASALTSGSSTSNKMKASDLIAFLIEEAQHRVINDERSKNSEQALAAHGKKKGKGKPNRAKGDEKALNADSDVKCHNCGKAGHKQNDCWSKGGGKEGQGPRSKQKKGKKAEAAVVAAVDDDDKELFAFTCTSDFANVAEALQVPKSRLGTCIDSRVG
jgi:gag-polypeptide of LTR copia-type